MNPACPVPFSRHDRVQLAHGGGGALTRELIDGLFAPAFGLVGTPLHDAVEVAIPGDRVVVATDVHVVDPLFFPGGDIGALAVHGTVNDLAMGGSRARALAIGWILEEGLPLDTLARVVESVRRTAEACGVRVVAGDTKVVPRGAADGLYLSCTGLGERRVDPAPFPARIVPGDRIWLSGDLGRHAVAVLACRSGLALETPLESDLADLAPTALAIADQCRAHCLRDVTRGGLAGVLAELSTDTGLGMEIEEERVPIGEAVRGACGLLGLDPFALACEGRFVAFVAPRFDSKTADLLGPGAAPIGVVGGAPGARVRGAYGVLRPLEMPYGELLPRIC
ncbi:MAG: hydrogenase expression/formation protein HypE [Armatimonadota bacterium]